MSIEKELRQNWDSVVYPEPDVVQQAMPPGYQEGDVLLAQATHPRTGRPMTGPTMSDVTEPAMGLLNMGASTLKGVTQGFLGLPGELEALVYGAKELLTRRADEGAFDAFINGLKKETILPTTEEVKKWLDTNVGEIKGVKTFETVGETLAPGGQYKAVKAGAKAIASKLNTVKPKDIPALFSHGTSESSANAIMESGKFDVSDADRKYTYSQFGRQAAYLTPEKGWWLDAERAANSRAITYDSAVDAKIDSKAKIVRVDSEQELNQLAKNAGFVDAYDMMKSLEVESIDYIKEARKAKSMTLEEYAAGIKKDWPDISDNSIKNLYDEMQTFEEKAFAESDKATKQLIDAGVDGIYISDKFNPEQYENWHPASDQLAMFRPELIKPVGKRSLKNSTSSQSGTTISTSQQEPK